jgi:SRSO17 transposase
LTARVQTKEDRRVGPEERLIVLRAVGESRIDYAVSNAGPDVPVAEVVGARCQRHRIEEMFEAGNGEAGLDHYEVRSWIGWHHHMTLALLALWFLCLERWRVGGKNPGHHGLTDKASVHAVIAGSTAETRGRCRRGHARVAA